MSMNTDLGWCTSLDGDWDLFGGEVKLDGVSYDCDTAALYADGTEDVGWQTTEDDAVSVSSSATSWSCLHSNSLLETCNIGHYFFDLIYLKLLISFAGIHLPLKAWISLLQFILYCLRARE